MKRLQVNFYDVSILKHIVALHHLPIVDSAPPHSGIFHFFKKILVNPTCQVF